MVLSLEDVKTVSKYLRDKSVALNMGLEYVL